jgi:hypothetical protein
LEVVNFIKVLGKFRKVKRLERCPQSGRHHNQHFRIL